MRTVGKLEGSRGVDDRLKQQLTSDYKAAEISDRDKLILAYAEKITFEPASIDQAYIDDLRGNGFDDHTLHDIVQVTSYFNYVNRLADGLGVELEE